MLEESELSLIHPNGQLYKDRYSNFGGTDYHSLCKRMVIKRRQSEVLKEFAKLTDSQKETIRKTVMGMIQVNDNLNSCIPEVCPVCES